MLSAQNRSIPALNRAPRRRVLLTECHCGCTTFHPIGIQEGWPGRNGNPGGRVLYLVNCDRCGTTKTCDRLQYALMQSMEALVALSDIYSFQSDKIAA